MATKCNKKVMLKTSGSSKGTIKSLNEGNSKSTNLLLSKFDGLDQRVASQRTLPSNVKRKVSNKVSRERKNVLALKSEGNNQGNLTKNSAKFRESQRSGVWTSPFKSFISRGTRHCSNTNNFAYDLSTEELKFTEKFTKPMKPLSQEERKLLQSAQSQVYLNNRYKYSPVFKYNFPEATSWRIGWFLNESDHKNTSK